MATAKEGRRYKHRKGSEYRVLTIAEHTETNEEMVVYYHTETMKMWVRPRAMFESDGRFSELP